VERLRDLPPATVDLVQLGQFHVEIRRSSLTLVVAYVAAGAVTALAGGHVELLGRDGVVVAGTVFVALAMVAVLVHELGHAVVAAIFGRRSVGLVLKAGAAVQIEEAPPGTHGAGALAESLVALGGPLASMLVGLGYLGVSTSIASPFAWAGLLAVVDALVNLVPVVGHSDGGRILKALTHHD
jgi:membrane-associated protease RseP (regulator of RpoE activity)